MPGQHLMFKLHIPGLEIPVFRYYSFSDSFNPRYYRVSIKKALPPGKNLTLPEGLASAYINDHIKEGDILEAKGPSGEFYLNPEDCKPVVLIAGGIGITPLLSMIKSIALLNPAKMVYLFYGVSERGGHSFQAELQKIAEDYDNLRITTFYSNIKSGDIKGLHYDYEGYMDIETILKITNEVDLDYYICGPAVMMNYITEELKKIGVTNDNINIESFNSQSDQDLEEEVYEPLPGGEQLLIDTEFSIEFLQSGKKIQWDKRYRSILEFAEGNDIEINSGCLFGDCGTCLTEIKEGTVHYMHKTMISADKGKCLPCSCIPTSNLTLNV
jgi:ferredoxin-NADP reductase